MGRHAPPPAHRVTKPSGTKSSGSQKKRRSPLWAKLFVGFGAVLVTLSGTTFIGGQVLANRYESSVNRGDLLGAARAEGAEDSPPKVDGPINFLIIGSDSRAGDNHNPNTKDGSTAAVGGERSDTIMLIHVPKSMDRAYAISFPRDLYVPIANKNGDPDGKDKINAAFAFGANDAPKGKEQAGGAARLVQTLNNFGDITIDYPIIVDFNAIRTITDLVGGVDVVVDETTTDDYRNITFKKGPLHLDGQMAEYYVRQRTNLPGGDLGRAQRQQQYLRALATKITSGGILTDPVKFDKFVKTAANSLTVDDSMPLYEIAFSLKSLRPSDLVFMTVPTAGFGNEDVGSVVYPDEAKAQELFTALNNDKLDEYILKYPPNDVSHGS